MSNPCADFIELECLASPDQQAMINCKAPIVIWVCGRRYGKTLSGRMKMLDAGTENPGCQVWYIALSYSKAKTEYRRFWQTLDRSIPGFVTWKSLQPHPEIHTADGTQYRFLSMDRPDNLRGEGVKLVFCDEAAKMKEMDFWEVVQPLTADVDGQIVLASTFYGENWFHVEYIKGTKPENAENYKSFLHPTSEGPAFQTKAGAKRLARIKATVPGVVYDQEYDCKPSGIADAALRGVELVLGGRSLARGEPGRDYINAWDMGGAVDHPAFAIGDAVSGQIVYVEVMPLGTSEDAQVARANVLCQLFNNALLVPDMAGQKGEWAAKLVRHLARDITMKPLNMSGANQEPYVREMALQIENSGRIGSKEWSKEIKAISYPAGEKELRRQLREYRYKYNERTKKYIYGAPDGDHDDAVAALALFCWARKLGWRSGKGLPAGMGVF